MKSIRRGAREALAKAANIRATGWLSSLGSLGRRVEIPLPAGLEEDFPEGSSVALVNVEGQRLKLQFPRPSLDQTPTLTEPEDAALALGGVEPISNDEVRQVEAQMFADYQYLLETSLSVNQASRRLRVNVSRVRQRLAEHSLFGIKRGHSWLLPTFQFTSRGLVPGVETVLKRLPSDISPIAVARWFNTPNPDLCTRDDQERPNTPLNWLLAGNSPDVAAELAAAL